MRIDLPCCGFKNCRYCFDGNCTKPSKQGRCEYWYLLHEKLEPAEPERTGKWITDNPNNPYESNYCKCSVCGYTNCTTEVLAFDGYNFCPNCGADMRGEQE